MIGIRPDLIAFSIVSTLLLAAVGGIFWSWVHALLRLRKGLCVASDKDLGTLPTRPAPWGLLTVAAIIFLYLGVNLTVHQIYSGAAGQACPPAAAIKPKTDAAAEAAKRAENVTVEKEPDAKDPKEAASAAPQSSTDLMLQLAVVNLILIVLVPVQLRLCSGATLADLGLHLRGWPRQMAAGVHYALLMTPVVYTVQIVAVRIWSRQEHPVEQMILNKFTVSGAILAILSTMVLAPLVEELLFRCIIQRWLCRLLGGSAKGEPPAFSIDESEVNLDILPVTQLREPTFSSLEQSAELPGAPLASALAIFFTSLLFAAMHFPQWPAPIAIFLLSMALGSVYQRTGSLIAAITMHGTFNGISTLLLLLAAISLRIHPQLRPPQGLADSIMVVLELLGHVIPMRG